MANNNQNQNKNQTQNQNQNQNQNHKKKHRSNGARTFNNYDIVKFCAYIAMAVAALAAILSFLFGLFHVCGLNIPSAGRVVGVCNTISQIALLIAVIMPAYYYTRGRTPVIKAFFWVAVIFLILGLVGINLAF